MNICDNDRTTRIEDSIIISSRKTQRLQTRYQQNASIADHQSIGQCNEASDDNMMDYSECLDMMRHQIIMLQKRKAPVNVVSVDNPWQEWWRIHPWKHMITPSHIVGMNTRHPPRWIETANDNHSSTSCSVSFGQGKRFLVSTVTERWPAPIHKAEQATPYARKPMKRALSTGWLHRRHDAT